MNKIFVNNIGDLSEAQRASFYRFLSTGISEELSHFPNPFFARVKILSKRKKVPCLVYLYPHEIKLKGPAATIDSCLKRDISYTIQLYISAEYSYSITDFLGKMENKLKYLPIQTVMRTSRIFQSTLNYSHHRGKANKCKFQTAIASLALH